MYEKNEIEMPVLQHARTLKDAIQQSQLFGTDLKDMRCPDSIPVGTAPLLPENTRYYGLEDAYWDSKVAHRNEKALRNRITKYFEE